MAEEGPGVGARRGLDLGLLLFVVWKGVGVLWGLAYLAFGVLWALPRFQSTSAEAAELRSFFVVDLTFSSAELAATLLGIALVLRRHRMARSYWICLLTLYCLARVSEAVFGLEPITPALFLVTGLGWLSYWIFAQAPRSLALSTFWTHAS
jgi:hypothetical protein